MKTSPRFYSVINLYWFACILASLWIVIPPTALLLAQFYLRYLAPWGQYVFSVLWTVAVNVLGTPTIVLSGKPALSMPTLPKIGV